MKQMLHVENDQKMNKYINILETLKIMMSAKHILFKKITVICLSCTEVVSIKNLIGFKGN